MTTSSGAPSGELATRLQRALGEAYEVRGPLGRGGFGIVYAAHDLNLKRDVAVKVLRPEYQDWPESRERFQREAEAAARLRHPNVIPIYAVGEGEGLSYFIMPLVAGDSLTARLQSGPLPVTEARRILREATQALVVAHRAGIIHRDVKPDNILLDGDERRVLLTDFGIAKALDPGAPGLTQTGAIIGSPQYMSPEQASGERALDHRTDIYSLGVVAYEMLTGELPFAGSTVTALLVKQISEEAPPVTWKRPECPSDLAAVVARCLAKEAAARWATADDLLRVLDAGPSATPPAPVAVAAAGEPGQLVQGFRRLLLWAGVAVVVLFAADVVMGRVLLGPVGLLLAAGVVAASFGRLWTVGYEWSDIMRGAARRRSVSITPDSVELGPQADAIRQARNDRAAMLGQIQRLPKADQRVLADVMPAVDRLLGRAVEIVRELRGVERQIDPGLEELDRRLAMARAEPASPGRGQRLAVLEGRRDAVLRLLERREQLGARLAEVLAGVTRVRLALESAGGAGARSALEAARLALGAAER